LRNICFFGIGLLVALTAGCAGRRLVAEVDSGLIIPPMSGAVDMPENQQFLFPAPVLRNPPPVYPEALIGLALPDQTVCLAIVIDEGGAVPSSAPVFDSPDCPSSGQPPRAEFLEAASKAVARWEFLAATVCTYPAGATKNDDCTGDDVATRQVAVKLSYRFRFKLVDGRGIVER
jgi:hypothetical protein